MESFFWFEVNDFVAFGSFGWVATQFFFFKKMALINTCVIRYHCIKTCTQCVKTQTGHQVFPTDLIRKDKATIRGEKIFSSHH